MSTWHHWGVNLHHLANTMFATLLYCTLNSLISLEISHKVLPTLKGSGGIKLYLLERGEPLYHLKFFYKEELSFFLYSFIHSFIHSIIQSFIDISTDSICLFCTVGFPILHYLFCYSNSSSFHLWKLSGWLLCPYDMPPFFFVSVFLAHLWLMTL